MSLKLINFRLTPEHSISRFTILSSHTLMPEVEVEWSTKRAYAGREITVQEYARVFKNSRDDIPEARGTSAPDTQPRAISPEATPLSTWIKPAANFCKLKEAHVELQVVTERIWN